MYAVLAWHCLGTRGPVHDPERRRRTRALTPDGPDWEIYRTDVNKRYFLLKNCQKFHGSLAAKMKLTKADIFSFVVCFNLFFIKWKANLKVVILYDNWNRYVCSPLSKELTRALWVSSALSFIGGVHIGARALHQKLDMVWLYRSPISVGRRGVISSFKWNNVT